MNTMPWDYWQKDGTAKPETARVLETLERVIARQPDHAGALHYHIHLLEASADPDRAAASADRLGSLMPAAGHMVHMPAHIYIRVGRYADAAEANVRAIAADEDYLAQCQAQGLYPGQLLPAQPALPVGGGDVRRATRSGCRGREESGGEGAASSCRRARVDGRLPGHADARVRALRHVAGGADRAEAAGRTSRTRSASGTTGAVWRLSRGHVSTRPPPS